MSTLPAGLIKFLQKNCLRHPSSPRRYRCHRHLGQYQTTSGKEKRKPRSEMDAYRPYQVINSTAQIRCRGTGLRSARAINAYIAFRPYAEAASGSCPSAKTPRWVHFISHRKNLGKEDREVTPLSALDVRMNTTEELMKSERRRGRQP